MLAAGDCPNCDGGFIDLTGGDGHSFHECQNCGHRWETWRCRHCGEKFDERPDRYDCPNCGPNESRIYK